MQELRLFQVIAVDEDADERVERVGRHVFAFARRRAALGFVDIRGAAPLADIRLVEARVEQQLARGCELLGCADVDSGAGGRCHLCSTKKAIRAMSTMRKPTPTRMSGR